MKNHHNLIKPRSLGHHFLNHGVIFYYIPLNSEPQALKEIVFLNICMKLFFGNLCMISFSLWTYPWDCQYSFSPKWCLVLLHCSNFYTNGLCTLHGHACLILCMICHSDKPSLNIFLLNNNWLVQAMSGHCVCEELLLVWSVLFTEIQTMK